MAAAVPFRRLLPPNHWVGLCQQAARHRRKAGTTLIRQGAPAEFVLLLDRGRAIVTKATDDGQSWLVAVRGPGDLLGEFAFVDCGPRSATVTALDDCDAFYLPTAKFDSYLRQNRLRELVERHVVSKARQGVERRTGQFHADPPVLVATLLNEMIAAGRCELASACEIPATQAELAGWLGIGRRSVVAALGTLRDHGLVSTAVRRITVLDPDGLSVFLKRT